LKVGEKERLVMTAELTFEAFREEWLEEIREGSPSTTELGHRFARKLFTQSFDIEDDSDNLFYCDGTGDGGIDIAYLDQGDEDESDASGAAGGHTWYLVQSKYGKAFQGVGTLFEEGRKVIETIDGQHKRLSSLVENNVLERLQTFRRQASDRDLLKLVFATENPLNEDQRRALEDIRILGRGRLGSIFAVETISIKTIYERNTEDTDNSTQATLEVPLEADLTKAGDDLLVGTVSLLKLYDFMRTYRANTDDFDRLYEKNVRLFLGNRRKVNRAMQQTLQDQPEDFGLYNNGITLIVENFEGGHDLKYMLTSPYVVNGCQTTRTIWEVCDKRLRAGGTGTDERNIEWKSKAAKGVVVIKVVKVGTKKASLVEAITRYTNSQNAVREKDFLALQPDTGKWAKEMADRYGVYLEIQRGGREARKARQKQNPSLTPRFTEWANAFDLLKVYGAGWLGEAGLAFGKNGPFLPDGRIFRKLVDDEEAGDSFGVEDLQAAYLLQKAADKYKFGRNAEKDQRKLTRFLFYMIVMKLLKYVLIHTTRDTDPSPKSLTKAFLKLAEPQNENARDALLQTAMNAVDEYMTEGQPNTIYVEPSYNRNVNTFLKSEQLGKVQEDTPHFHSLIARYGSVMGMKPVGAQASVLSLIDKAINR
jgi:hypothetical protein